MKAQQNYLFKIFLSLVFFGVASGAWAQSLSELERAILVGEEDSPEVSLDTPESSTEGAFEISKDDVDEDELEEIEQAITGPERIPYEQVFVVQRRFIEKENKQEITPFFLGIQPADSFRRQFQWGFSWAYHFTESFGIEGLHAAFMTNYSTGLDEDIKDTTGLLTNYGVTPVVVLGSNLLWTPFRSKSATRTSVYHFETYLSAGAGAAFSETSRDPLGIFGLGFRAYMNKRSLLKLELRDYMQFSGSSRHRLSLVLGGAILL